MSNYHISVDNATIAAVATPLGEGGLGIVRLSGSQAISIANRIFHGKKTLSEAASHTAHHGVIIIPETKAVVDEVVATVFIKPHSYTGEDVVEFSCHGGLLVTSRVLEVALNNGCRLAQPGEFTLRAFLNERIDLTQAEAVVDIIRAKTDLSLKAGIEQLSGRLSKLINQLRDQLIDLLAQIEAALDFPEEKLETRTAGQLLLQLKSIQAVIEHLLTTYQTGRIVRDGIAVVIAGRPNVGKSSLLNALLKEERAIVTPYAGTTRDIIREYANFYGVPVKLVDTAGLRLTRRKIEQIGIQRTEMEIEQSDLVLFVCDAKAGFGAADRRQWNRLKERPRVAVINKIDLVSNKELNSLQKQFNGISIASVSALNGSGIDQLKRNIARLALPAPEDEKTEVVVTTLRHKEALALSLSALAQVETGLKTGRGFEYIAFDLRQAVSHLGEIIGKVVTEDILERIFSTFCIGK